MSKKIWIIIIIFIIGLGGLIYAKQSAKPKEPPLGVQHASQGEQHIQQGQEHEAYNSSPASSGPHYADASAPTQWGIYTTEVAEEVFLHNAEHGGVIITYSPTLLPQEDLRRLQALFAPPYESDSFQPRKFILTPRTKNTKPIQLAAWRYTLDLDSYDEAKIKAFFSQRAGKAPEASAGPSNAPINQAVRN